MNELEPIGFNNGLSGRLTLAFASEAISVFGSMPYLARLGGIRRRSLDSKLRGFSSSGDEAEVRLEGLMDILVTGLSDGKGTDPTLGTLKRPDATMAPHSLPSQLV